MVSKLERRFHIVGLKVAARIVIYSGHKMMMIVKIIAGHAQISRVFVIFEPSLLFASITSTSCVSKNVAS